MSRHRPVAVNATVPRYSPALQRLFARYLGGYLRRHFHGVRVAFRRVPRVPIDRPVVVYCNHPSWWDPLLLLVLAAELFPHHRGFGPIESTAIGRYPLLERVGLFGIAPGTHRGALEFIRIGRALLAQAGNMLWVTAEGEFRDARQRPVQLRRGLAHLARAVPDALLIPLAVEYTFWNESRPELLCAFGEAIEASRVCDPALTRRAGTSLLAAALEQTLDELAAASLRRDPADFRSLLTGRTGVGGVYDAWRRWRAWRRGVRFDPSHERLP